MDLRSAPSSRAAHAAALSWDRRDTWAVAGVCALALALRALFLAQYASYPLAQRLHMDPLIHHQWAFAFARGEGAFWEGAYFRAPLYPWLLGFVYRVFGPDPWIARVIQIGLGSASCGVLYFLGRRVFGRPTGLVAGLAAATYPMLLYFDVQLLIEVLIIQLDLLLLLCLFWARAGGRPGRWLLAGLLLGLSATARPNILLFAPAVVLWILLLRGLDWRLGLRDSALVFVGTMLPILPITVRNWVAGDELSLIATQGGVNWYIGNNPGSDGMTAVLPGDPADWWGCYDAQIERAEQAMGQKLSGTEVSRYYAELTREFFVEHPRRAATLFAKKLLYFWTHWEITNNEDIRYVLAEHTPMARWLPLSFWIVGPLGILGLVLCLRRPIELFPLWSFVPIYMSTVVAFFVTARYRMPVVAVLLLLAAHAAVWLVGAAAGRRWRSLALAALVLAPALLLVAQRPPVQDTEMFQAHRTVGLYHFEVGEWDEAASTLEEALRRKPPEFPDKPRIWYYLGHARKNAGDLAGARDAFLQAIAIDPSYGNLRASLAELYLELGQPREAAEQYDYALRANDEDTVALVRLGEIYAGIGRYDGALPLVLRAATLDPSLTPKAARLAQEAWASGQRALLLERLRAAVAGSPDHVPLLTLLVQFSSLAADHDLVEPDEAVRLAEQALALDPTDDPAVLHAAAGAYARAGRFDDALATQQRALVRAEETARTDLVPSFRQALEGYRAQRDG